MASTTPRLFWIEILVLLGFILCLGSLGNVQGVNISPSKYQGGKTNDPPNKTEGAPSLFSFKWIFGGAHSEAMNRVKAPPEFDVKLFTDPKNFSPGTNSLLKAQMFVFNKSREKYILEFTSAQHHDFIISGKDNTEIYRWSSDKSFSQQLSSMVINRNEKLVYEEELFSPSNQVVNLPPGEYRLTGKVTSKVPISVEVSFQVLP